MKRAPRSRQRHDLYAKYHDYDSEISDLLGECGFIQIYDASGASGARMLIRHWLRTVPDDMRKFFHEPISTLQTREDHVVNYFDHPFTNGYTEAANALVKGMNRMGRGYSLEAIRAKMLYNRKALAKSAVRIDRPRQTSGDEFGMGLLTSASMMPVPRSGSSYEMRYYGPHIPTLVEMLENGEFENPKPLKE